MPPPRASSAESAQSTQQIAEALESFLADNPRAALLEDGRLLFDLRTAKYSLTTEHARCTSTSGATIATSSAASPPPPSATESSASPPTASARPNPRPSN